jgi:hypothetical protein
MSNCRQCLGTQAVVGLAIEHGFDHSGSSSETRRRSKVAGRQGSGSVMSLRRSVHPDRLVAAPPTGVRIRTRLHVSPDDERVLRQIGGYLAQLAGRDLADRCRLGLRDNASARRAKVLTAATTSRWASTIMRTSESQWQRGYRNLLQQRTSLRRAIDRIESRLAAPIGGRRGRVRGYATAQEHWEKRRRRLVLQGRLSDVEARIADGRVSVVRGGRRLAKTRHNLGKAKIEEGQWRERWDAERLFLSANGSRDRTLGNGTIRVHPIESWLELRLPAPLLGLANQPHSRYRLSCRVTFSHQAEAWRTQVFTGSVRYDISYDSSRRRWYLDASWRLPSRPIPDVAELTTSRVVAVDLNAGHLACWVVDPAGNPLGQARSIPLDLDGLDAATRDGRLRAAISELIATARAHDCRALAIEHLDFEDVRAIGRERLGRGRLGKRVRHAVSGIPTARFRDRLVQMCANQGLWVLAVNPAYTSKWGRQYWLRPLQQRTSTATVHHAAAVVIGRRALGHRARRRSHVPTGDQRIAAVESCGSGRSPNRGRSGTRPSETRLRSDLASHQTDSGDRSRSGTRPFSTVRDGPAPTQRR